MIGRWFGAPHGSHRVPAPDSLLGHADRVRAAAAGTEPGAVTRTVRVLPATPPLVDTVAFNASELWTRPLPKQTTAPTPTPPPQVLLSPGRDFKMVTARASSFRFPLVCFTCHREHYNLNADRFRDLYASAARAGWHQDLYGTSWRCPRCVRRARFGIHPVAAIAPPATPRGVA